MDRQLRRVKRKLELLDDPVVQELMEDLLSELIKGGDVSSLIISYNNIFNRPVSKPRYRQMDLEEAIAIELQRKSI